MMLRRLLLDPSSTDVSCPWYDNCVDVSCFGVTPIWHGVSDRDGGMRSRKQEFDHSVLEMEQVLLSL